MGKPLPETPQLTWDLVYRLQDDCRELQRKMNDAEYEAQRASGAAELARDQLRRENDLLRSRAAEDAERVAADQRQTSTKMQEVTNALEDAQNRYRALEARTDRFADDVNQIFRETKQHESENRREINELSAQLEAARIQAADFKNDLEFESSFNEELDEGLTSARNDLRRAVEQCDNWKERCQRETALRERETECKGSAESELAALRSRLDSERGRGRRELAEELEPAFTMVRCGLACENLDDAGQLWSVAAQRFFQIVPLMSIANQVDQPLTAKAAAKFLKIAKATLREISPVELPFQLVGSGGRKRHRRYLEPDLVHYLSRR